MQLRCFLIAITALHGLSHGLPLAAHTTTLATTGDTAAGIPSATWRELGTATLNNSGAAAFAATLQHTDNISADNDTGIWLLDNTLEALLARSGSAGVPGIVDADFESFNRADLSDSGDVVVGGMLVAGANGVTSDNKRGIWRYETTNGSLIARTGSGDVPDVAGADFSGFPTPLGPTDVAIADDGRVTVMGIMLPGVGGVLSSNDRGLWTYSSGAKLVVREGGFDVPGVPGARFGSFAPPAVNANDQLTMLASLKTDPGITGANNAGIWRYTGTTGELLARSGSLGVPGVSNVDFFIFDAPRINNPGQVAFRSSLSNDAIGVWLYSDDASELLALSAAGGVPDVLGADFNEFAVQSINDAGQVLVEANLEIDVGGVTADDDAGLWLLNTDESLVARSGNGGVPGVPEANYAEFVSSSLNDRGQVAFAADLQLGIGDVDDSNDGGIWIVDPKGGSWLVAREGDQLAGRTVASLDFRGDAETQSSGFNDAGELAFRATFTNGDSGLFLFRPYSADFDRDGDVDADDLTVWHDAFGPSSAGDADGDGDSDGADFLTWQRELDSGLATSTIVAVVPEPASWLLLLAALLSPAQRRRGRRN